MLFKSGALDLISATTILQVVAASWPLDQVFMKDDMSSPGPGNYQLSRNDTESVLEIVEEVTNPKVAVSKIKDNDGKGPGKDEYTLYPGNGSAFPKASDWVSFGPMWESSKKAMKMGCGRYKVPADTDAEIKHIHSAIQTIAEEAKVDHRMILAVVMQESTGCVRVNISNFGVRNPGLMQDHDGNSECNDNHRVKTPCPKSEILGMIREGTAGTKSGDGIAECINKAKASDVTAFYKAARIYNSGAIARSGNLEDGKATHCYASDIANRLTGWINAPTKCHLDG